MAEVIQGTPEPRKRRSDVDGRRFFAALRESRRCSSSEEVRHEPGDRDPQLADVVYCRQKMRWMGALDHHYRAPAVMLSGVQGGRHLDDSRDGSDHDCRRIATVGG